MYFQQITEPKLAQNAYLIGCQQTGEAIVIDPMRDIDRYIDIARSAGLRIVAVAETHIHADYLSGAREFSERTKAKVFVADSPDPHWRFEWALNGSSSSRLLKDGDVFHVGNIEFQALSTPGHTPEHMAYLVTDRGGNARQPMGILSGDFVFVGDVGRPDLLESAAGETGAMVPAARTLFRSLQQFRKLPPFLQVWPGHGAGSACGKALGAVPISTVGYELQFNPSLQAAESEENFVNYILDGQPEPPMYFARMKTENHRGPALLGTLPEPQPASAENIAALLKREGVAIVDTRPWQEFRSGHLPGSIHAPLGSSFNTIAGCYVNPEEEIYLVTEASHCRECVTDLIRIGLDNVAGFIPPSELAAYRAAGGTLAGIEEVNVHTLAAEINRGQVRVLDVRRAAEWSESGHIPGAINIAHTRLLPRLAEIPRDKPLLVHCRSGVRSSYASAFLKKHGFNASNVAGGFLAWERAGGEILKD